MIHITAEVTYCLRTIKEHNKHLKILTVLFLHKRAKQKIHQVLVESDGSDQDYSSLSKYILQKSVAVVVLAAVFAVAVALAAVPAVFAVFVAAELYHYLPVWKHRDCFQNSQQTLIAVLVERDFQN